VGCIVTVKAAGGRVAMICVIVCMRHLHVGQIWGAYAAKVSGKNCTTVLAVQKGQIFFLKVLCLVIVNVNVTKYVPQKCQI